MVHMMGKESIVQTVYSSKATKFQDQAILPGRCAIWDTFHDEQNGDMLVHIMGKESIEQTVYCKATRFQEY